jgi:hypothetical protein
MPIAQYWFLETLLLIFCLAPWVSSLFERFNCGEKIQIMFFLLVYLFTCYYEKGFFVNYVRYFGFFWLGCLVSNGFLKIHNIKLKSWNLLLLFFILIVLCVIAQNSITNTTVSELVRWGLSSLNIIWLYVTTGKIRCWKVESVLQEIYPYTMHIFLFHTWIIGIVRVLLLRVGVEWYMQILACVVFGFFISLLIGMICVRYPVLNFCIQPIKTITKIKNVSQNEG